MNERAFGLWPSVLAFGQLSSNGNVSDKNYKDLKPKAKDQIGNTTGGKT